jgi:hypothetical protein
LQATGACQQEIHRRDRLEQTLAQLLQAARSRQIRVAPESRSRELVNTRVQKLPTGVELSASRLTIDFRGTDDFLEKIGAVVFALQNDYAAVSEFIENAGGRL